MYFIRVYTHDQTYNKERNRGSPHFDEEKSKSELLELSDG